MNAFQWPNSNYDKSPFIKVKGYSNQFYKGWPFILDQINAHISSKCKRCVVVIECYPGVFVDELKLKFSEINFSKVYQASDSMKNAKDIDELVYPDVTDDQIFGHITRLNIEDFFDKQKLKLYREEIKNESGIILIIGTGAFLLAQPDILIYADMPRWEGQLRFRENQAANLGTHNYSLKASLQYKRAYFVDWRVCDRLKKEIFDLCDYFLDTVLKGQPKMITAGAMAAGLNQAITRPFRVVPFFDPGPWGGQWMKRIFELDKKEVNYAWCFDCVPEENSLLFSFDENIFELPAINLVFLKPVELLGKEIYNKLGDEFPIRFDLLDTMAGGNLSLQVHPTTPYIREHFGMSYTQDESYYILDADVDASVYLGLKENINPEKFMNELETAQLTRQFDVEKYVNKWPAKKHDHFLIPAGTVHCSGANSVVLEISATPYIFTFKLWDWARLGLDGQPRPLKLTHGNKVIDWSRQTKWTKENLINTVQKVEIGEGWVEESTGLHKQQFIETRRHWFSNKVSHDTEGNLNVLNLVEGREVIVESPSHSFSPFIVHYAETFIIPANLGKYSIRPYGESEGDRCATIKAYFRASGESDL